jgi:DNA-binding NtrC family response regulator
MERAVALSDDDSIREAHLPEKLRATPSSRSSPRALVPPPPSSSSVNVFLPDDDLLRSGVEHAERTLILRALEKCGGNQTKAAQALGISRRTLVTRLTQYALPRPRKLGP